MVVITLVSRALGYRVPSHEIGLDHSFDDLSICGLDRVCIANEVEEHFKIELSDDEVEQWERVADVALSVERARAT